MIMRKKTTSPNDKTCEECHSILKLIGFEIMDHGLLEGIECDKYVCMNEICNKFQVVQFYPKQQIILGDLSVNQ